MNTFILGYFLFISTQILREFVFRRGIEAKSMKLGKYDKGTSIVNITYLATFSILPLLLAYLKIGFINELHLFGIFGILLMLLGKFIHFAAIKTLGEQFTRTLTITEKHSIMKNGIYKKIRHPGYLGSILVGLGFGIASYNWIFLLTTIALLSFAYTYRIQSEEAMLTKQFGKEYVEYKRNSWALIPYIL